MDVGAVASENLRVTGSVTVTSLGTAVSGVTRTLRAAAGFQLTHSANIVCPSAANLVLLADDFVVVSSLGGGVWHVTGFRALATTTAPGLQSADDKVKVNGAPSLVRLAEVATTSGTAFDFTGLPSDVVEIKIQFVGVSLSGTDDILVQLGDAGGFETTGYTSTSTITNATAGSNATSTAGFIINLGAAVAVRTGEMQLSNIVGTNMWTSTQLLTSGSASSLFGAGSKSLSDVLTQIRVTRTGSNTFDLGGIAVSYTRAS
jgi:hypothetical protein